VTSATFLSPTLAKAAMDLQPDALDELYRLYGFRVQTARPDLRVYVLRQGYLHGVDIVHLRETADSTELEASFKSSGYATNVRRYTSLAQARDELFRGFFSTEATSERLGAYYRDFAQRRTVALGARYQYIPCPYTLNGGERQSDGAIVDSIMNAISANGPQLIIIEAAAGFGKTCTAYELLPRFFARPSTRLPIFTELSKNRQARLFRYVLLDEIDKHYAGLTSSLVQDEIATGRVPLVIDGFDELLNKREALPGRVDEAQGDFESVESMLDTIGDLLRGDAKIVLTTRRTAIFSGPEFSAWAESRQTGFSLLRVTIHEPDLVAWLGPERAAFAETNAEHIRHIKNPVLLTFLKNLNDAAFRESCLDSEGLITKYFQSLLDREQQRQELRLDADRQLVVFRRLAKRMTDDEIVSDSRESISTMILYDSADLIEAARMTYAPAERPTIEGLADKLTSHALLDRVGHDDNAIGFVNEFVLGILIGDNVSTEVKDEWVSSERFFNLATTAYKTRSRDLRFGLWKKATYCAQFFDPATQVVFDVDLAGRQMRPVNDATLDKLTLSDGVLGDGYILSNSVFINGVFRRMTFHLDGFTQVGFLNCQFYECGTVTSDGLRVSGNWIRGCKEFDGVVLASLGAAVAPHENDDEALRVRRESAKRILERFWPAGRQNAHLVRQLRTLLLGFGVSDMTVAYDAIEDLKTKQIVTPDGDLMVLNTDRINEIRKILGRT
jgi:NACHT-associated inactive Restriction Endonuclease 2